MTRSPSAAALALVAGLLALPLAGAGAQITTGLTPPPGPREIQRQVAAESTVVAARDSVATAERRDMRAWVDSAARSLEAGGSAVTPMPAVPGDSLVPTTPTAPAAPAAPAVPSVNSSPVIPPGGEAPAAPPTASPAGAPPASSAPTTRFREGAPAPDTATPLPALLLAAAGLAGGGAALLRRR